MTATEDIRARIEEIEGKQRILGWVGPANEWLRQEREYLIAELRRVGEEWRD